MKGVLYILAIALLAFGCTTQKSFVRYGLKHPEAIPLIIDTTHRVEFKTDTVWKPVTIIKYLPADTVYRDTIINRIGIISGHVEAENQYARAEAWVKDSVLSIALYLKEQAMKVHDTIPVISTDTTTTDTITLPPVRFIPKWCDFFKYGFFILLPILLFVIAMLIRAVKK